MARNDVDIPPAFGLLEAGKRVLHMRLLFRVESPELQDVPENDNYRMTAHFSPRKKEVRHGRRTGCTTETMRNISIWVLPRMKRIFLDKHCPLYRVCRGPYI